MKSTYPAPWEIRAYMEGRKSQFRLPIKPQPHESCSNLILSWDTWLEEIQYRFIGIGRWKAPYQIGETIYCKETWRQGFVETKFSTGVIYKTDAAKSLGMREYSGGWHSPITMPEWASRLKLCILDVGVERLQDISYPDVKNEGVGLIKSHSGYINKDSMFQEYFKLWNQTHPKYDWASNPWVWK